MISFIERVIISDKNRDGTPRINKNGDPYKMISICVEGVRASKYRDSQFPDPILEPGILYDIELEENGQYTNIKSIKNYINKEFMVNIVYGNLLEEGNKELGEFLSMEIESCVDEAQAIATIELHLGKNRYQDAIKDLVTKII